MASFLNWPSYRFLLGHVYTPWPCFLSSTKSPVYFSPLAYWSVLFPCFIPFFIAPSYAILYCPAWFVVLGDASLVNCCTYPGGRINGAESFCRFWSYPLTRWFATGRIEIDIRDCLGKVRIALVIGQLQQVYHVQWRMSESITFNA